MTLENDDKTYTTSETLAICQKEQNPFRVRLSSPHSEPL